MQETFCVHDTYWRPMILRDRLGYFLQFNCLSRLDAIDSVTHMRHFIAMVWTCLDEDWETNPDDEADSVSFCMFISLQRCGTYIHKIMHEDASPPSREAPPEGSRQSAVLLGLAAGKNCSG